MFDVIILLLFLYIAWSVASENAWQAATSTMVVFFAGLLSMNFFEPCAEFLEKNVSSNPSWNARWDILCLLGIFSTSVFALKYFVDRLVPCDIYLHDFLEIPTKLVFSAFTGYLTIAILMTALHTAPLPRDYWGYFIPEPQRRDGLLGRLQPDYHWLGITQYVSEVTFPHAPEIRIFDAPRFRAGTEEEYWSSFPIRYATRRALLEAEKRKE